MTVWWLAFILGFAVVFVVGFAYILVVLNRLQAGNHKGKGVDKTYAELAEEETSHLFNREFREELRNRGRLRFESIIDENVMFLQQDLRLTTSQLNEYMKKQVSAKLDNEFAAYAKTMKDLQELAKESLEQTTGEVE